MEPRGCNQWQPVASGRASQTAETSQTEQALVGRVRCASMLGSCVYRLEDDRGGVRNVFDGACCVGVAVGGVRREAAGGRDPLDVGCVRKAVSVGAGTSRRGGKEQPGDRGGIDGDTILDVADNVAAVLGLPCRSREMGRD
jgi:hypothetical protein